MPNIISLQQKETIWMSRLLIHLITSPKNLQNNGKLQTSVRWIRPLHHKKNKLEMTKCRFYKKTHSLRGICLEVYIEIRAVLFPGQLDAVSYISASSPTHHFRIDHYI